MATRLSKRAERDLKRMGRGPERARIVDRLAALGRGDENVQIKAVSAQGWSEARAGLAYRLLFRPLGGGDVWVERIVHHGDLEQAVAGLPKVKR